ncbi:MAG TPA: hypothetical protein ENJ89_08255 [Caldithrix abyssi]|uniref:DUF8082 domain-containing protein n=1 Tax=Caldithrix abyssi TaxID=187145 RepID=A0A7V5UF91_CALAY|nr:hypothetical protein [Caldithrix abyssi]
MSKTKSPSEVTLRSAEWAIITQIDGHKSIHEISRALAMTMDEAMDLFNGLYQKGLIDIISTEKIKETLIPVDFFDRLQTELTKIIGPVAPFVIDDVLWNMNCKKDAVPVDRLPELIETISEEIPDEKKKLTFQQQMLVIMEEYNKK